MSYVTSLTSLFGDASNIEKCENFSFYELKATVTNPCTWGDLESLIEQHLIIAKQNDVDVALTIRFNGQEPVRFTSNNIENIESELDEYFDRVESSINIELRVDKPKNSIHIFDMNTFSSYHSELELEECFRHWSKYDFKSKIKIKVWEAAEPFETNSITCLSVHPDINSPSNISSLVEQKVRKKTIANRDKCGHFANAKQIEFIPDDFRVVTEESSNPLEKDIKKLFNCLLVIYISDFASIEDDEIKYRLKGYKLISESLTSNSLDDANLSELDDIYKWTYGDGDFSDKMGLSRNIISIHLASDSILSIESGTASSVRSGYDLYLRENVKQYIDIKNKISEFILSQSDKAAEIPKSMFDMFKTNLWTFTTFFISMFLLRIFKGGSLEGVFTVEIFSISLLLILFSFIFLIVTTSEVNTDKRRLLNKYSQIRDRYKDLLDKKDLKKVFDAEQLKKDEEGYINKKRNKYIAVWAITNVILLATVVTMYLVAQSDLEKSAEAKKLDGTFIYINSTSLI